MFGLLAPIALALQPTLQPPIAPFAPKTAPDVDWVAVGEATLAKNKAKKQITTPARNVILFIGDGMDGTTVTAGRIYAGQQQGGLGEDYELALDTLPFLALAKTYNVNLQVPDSAGTATAMVTGRKTLAGVISVDQGLARGDCANAAAHELPTIMDYAAKRGRAIGVVSTARITHATPATLYAHSPDRNWESNNSMPASAAGCADIATQLLSVAQDLPIKVALGGGRQQFMPNTMTDPEYPEVKGYRTDGIDLLTQWTALSGKHKTIWNGAQFNALNPKSGDVVLGLFEPSHMQYESDRASDAGKEPSLADMTKYAIDRLSTEDNGYFLMVEGGRIDHAHHGGNAQRALQDVIAFDQAVAAAMATTNPEDTLIIVTADHGHTMYFQGYPQRGNPILGVVHAVGSSGAPSSNPYPAADGKPYTVLGYGNGPGSPFVRATQEGRIDRPFVSNTEAQNVDYIQQAATPALSESHGGQDVTIYANGPKAYLFDGVVEQNYIYYVMREALKDSVD